MPKQFPKILYVVRDKDTDGEYFEIRHGGPTDTMLENGDAIARYQLLDTGKAVVQRDYEPAAKAKRRK